VISQAYRDLNAELHQRMPEYGIGGGRWAAETRKLLERVNGQTVLDYGCGKGGLAASLAGIDVREYDPAIPGKDALPKPAHVVVCTDVFEHVEAPFVAQVIRHLRQLSRRALLVNVSLVVGSKRLADGTPAHCTVRPAKWWLSRLETIGQLHEIAYRSDSLTGYILRGK